MIYRDIILERIWSQVLEEWAKIVPARNSCSTKGITLKTILRTIRKHEKRFKGNR